ncbi:unnamed protein product, partial [Didymodactylos carnosus]
MDISVLGTTLSPLKNVHDAVFLQQLNTSITPYDPKRNKHIQEIFNNHTGYVLSEFEIKALLDKWKLLLPLYNERIFNPDNNIKKIITDYCRSIKDRISLCYNVICSKQQTCCSKKLTDPLFGKNVTIFSSSSVEDVLLLKKVCLQCNTTYYPHYVIKSDNIDYIIPQSFDEYILLFGTKGYSRELMNQFDGDILIKYSSFDAFAKVYLYKQEV